jgi:hypothetical protein
MSVKAPYSQTCYFDSSIYFCSLSCKGVESVLTLDFRNSNEITILEQRQEWQKLREDFQLSARQHAERYRQTSELVLAESLSTFSNYDQQLGTLPQPQGQNPLNPVLQYTPAETFQQATTAATAATSGQRGNPFYFREPAKQEPSSHAPLYLLVVQNSPAQRRVGFLPSCGQAVARATSAVSKVYSSKYKSQC